MAETIFGEFDEEINEESESVGHLDAFTALSVGARDWTVDTIIDQIRKGNVNLDPAFQRRNAWNDQKRSRFIESLILGVPIPQIVLAEQVEARGKFLVIDGKQRLLTLAGLSMTQYSFWDRRHFEDLNTLKDLNGVEIDAFLSGDDFDDERRLFGNAPIRCAVLSGSSDKDVFYDIFFRLNSGAVPLSGQELRQVFYKGDFAQYLFEITSNVGPLHMILGLDQPDPRLFDVELILRYLAICLGLTPYRGDLRAYLDITMDTLTNNWAAEKPRVAGLYEELNDLLVRLDGYIGAEKVGRRFTKHRLNRRFNKAVFEVEAFYFRLIPAEKLTPESKELFLEQFMALCDDPDFRSSIEATTKSIDRFRTRFSRFRQLVNDVYKLDLTEAPAIAD